MKQMLGSVLFRVVQSGALTWLTAKNPFCFSSFVHPGPGPARETRIVKSILMAKAAAVGNHHQWSSLAATATTLTTTTKTSPKTPQAQTRNWTHSTSRFKKWRAMWRSWWRTSLQGLLQPSRPLSHQQWTPNNAGSATRTIDFEWYGGSALPWPG